MTKITEKEKHSDNKTDHRCRVLYSFQTIQNYFDMKKYGILLLNVALISGILLLVSCQQKRTQTSEDPVREELNELKADLQDIGRELDNATEKEGDEFKTEAKRAIDRFNNKIDEFERDMKEAGREIDAETQEIIDDLEAEGKQLDAKLERYGDESQADWQEFKNEVKSDFKEFGESIENFFEDNV